MGLGRMIPNDQSAEISWTAPSWTDGGVPVSDRFGDPYFSLKGGLQETRHVFLSGNGLPERLTDGFHIAELGFGTGLNLLALHIAFAATGRPGTLRFTSFEAFPMRADDMRAALAAFPEVLSAAAPFLSQWAEGRTRLSLPGIEAEILLGDAQSTLPAWDGRADAWFLDGFSPARNPEMWGEDILQAVARHTAPGGTFATYTAAGHVRRALAEAGFTVERRPGFGTKRHMTAGWLT
jgi:tRNA U34 5-methylaminomethyl-2-thiouridine-forming methyltransferase MnmC